jgi:hypothetical protein
VLGPRSSAVERPDGVDTTATSRPLVRCAHAGIVSVLAFLSQVRHSPPLLCFFVLLVMLFAYTLSILTETFFSLLVPSSGSLFSSLLIFLDSSLFVCSSGRSTLPPRDLRDTVPPSPHSKRLSDSLLSTNLHHRMGPRITPTRITPTRVKKRWPSGQRCFHLCSGGLSFSWPRKRVRLRTRSTTSSRLSSHF